MQAESAAITNEPGGLRRFGGMAAFFIVPTKRTASVYNNFTLPAILAHEVGHIVQFHEGSRLATKPKELQADYLAGWYMANRDRSDQWSETSVQQNMSGFFRLGDYDYNSPDHHGTPNERFAALVAGFRNANLSLPAVYRQLANH